MDKSADAFRTITEVAGELGLPQHVLRFWETRFSQIKPLKRAGGRRYYRPRDVELLRAIKHLLYGEGYTIKGVQRVLREQGVKAVAAAWDVENEKDADFPLPSPRELLDPMGSPCWQNEHAENGMASSGGESLLPEPRAATGRDYGADGNGKNPPWPLALTAEDIARLRAALAELAGCKEILEAARYR
jgi:DNA-binding transcriptional MerR regulator